jgi:glycosyltransferase involved in cell wall biosynthesis
MSEPANAGRPAPRVSAVLPCYNAAAFVAEALESLLAQNYRDFEVLALDDGSSDTTLAILQSFAARDSRVQAIACPHRGLVATLNDGLERARGEYIARLDADDIALPGRFARQVAYLDAHPACVLVGSRAERIDSDGEPISRTGRLPLDAAAVAEKLRRKRMAVLHPAVMARRTAMLAAGGYYAHEFGAEDTGLWRRMLDHGEIVNLPDVLIRKRRHAGAITLSRRMKRDGLSQAAVHRRLALRAAWQRYPVAAQKHAWRAWRGQPARIHWLLFAAALTPPAAIARLARRLRNNA